MPGFVNISEAASNGIHAMVLLAAEPSRLHSAKDISALFNISTAHLSKVMQRLVRAGLVISTRGPTGGYKLARPSGEITLWQITEAIEGALEEKGCLLSREVCGGGSCLLGDAIAQINHTIRQTLSKKSLADLAASFLQRNPDFKVE